MFLDFYFAIHLTCALISIACPLTLSNGHRKFDFENIAGIIAVLILGPISLGIMIALIIKLFLGIPLDQSIPENFNSKQNPPG